ncbi:MAG: amidohydrolase [Spirochaetales bacterium]|nr:amidohydrolase [Spirochaetales bacterium]
MKPGQILWYNAKFLTGDPSCPHADAVLTIGDTIAFVGALEEGRQKADPWVQSVNLEGGFAVPGFNDNHLHLVIYGDHISAPDLSGLNENQILDRLKSYYDDKPRDTLVVGYAWDYPSCPHPRKELLDEVFGSQPVLLSQFGGHGVWVNSRVLRDLGISRELKPTPGLVLRDPDGEPTGVLREYHPNPIQDKYFHEIFYKKDFRETRLAASLDALRRLGITSVQDNTWHYPALFSLARWRNQGRLTARVSAWSFGRVPQTIKWMNLGSYDRVWLRRGPWKYFLDGTFTTKTAWMEEPYPGTDDHGMDFDPAWLQGVLLNLAKRKVQGAFHSIGDRSTRTFLDVWEDVLQKYPDAVKLRMRLEHVQALRREDIPRLKALGICVAAQPPAMATPEKDASVVGASRVPYLYPHRSLLEAGVPLSFGSDIPGEAFCDPLQGMHLVCNREGPERLTPEQALRCYTEGSAFVEFQEARKGRLAKGYLADFTVLTADPLATPPENLRLIQCVKTVVGAKMVWDATQIDGLNSEI